MHEKLSRYRFTFASTCFCTGAHVFPAHNSYTIISSVDKCACISYAIGLKQKLCCPKCSCSCARIICTVHKILTSTSTSKISCYILKFLQHVISHTSKILINDRWFYNWSELDEIIHKNEDILFFAQNEDIRICSTINLLSSLTRGVRRGTTTATRIR